LVRKLRPKDGKQEALDQNKYKSNIKAGVQLSKHYPKAKPKTNEPPAKPPAVQALPGGSISN
jgi:hypothetical protein